MTTTTVKDGWVHTACGMCYMSCGIRVKVENGVVVSVEGDPNNPQNRGKMCAKGKAGIMNLYNPHRVKAPLRRTNPQKGRGVDPGWQEISWEEALDFITERLKAIQDDPKRLFVQAWDVVSDNYFWMMAFTAAFGTPHIHTGASPTCGKVIHPMEFISGGGFHQQPDFHYCNYALLVGTQMGVAARGSFNHLATDLAEARERGMKLVVVDPVGNYAASKADEWVPIRPGTDGAFGLGLLYVLIHELGIYDAEFLKHRTNAPYLVGPDNLYVRDPETGKPLIYDTADQRAKLYDDLSLKEPALEGHFQIHGSQAVPAFVKFKEGIREYPPDRVEEITTVPASTLRRIAREFGEAAQVGATITIDGTTLPYRPACVDWARGPQGHKHGFHHCWSLKLVNIIMGAINVPGGIQSTGVAGKRPYEWWPEGGMDGLLEHGGSLLPLPHPSAFPGRTPTSPIRQDLLELFPLATHSTTAMPVVAQDPSYYKLPYSLEMIIHTPANYVLGSFGDTAVVERFYQSVPFVVGFAVELNETNEMDDIILPFPAYLERMDFGPALNILIPPSNDRYYYWQTRQRVAEPPPGMLMPQEVFTELASRLGILDDFYKVLSRTYNLKEPHRLESRRRYTQEEVYDHIARSWFGPEHDWSWFKEHGVLPIPRDVDERYPGPFIKARIPIYLEHMTWRRRQLEEVIDELGISWDFSDYHPLPQWMPCDSFNKLQEGEYDLIAVHYKLAFVYGTYGNANPWINEICERTPYTYTILMNTEVAKRKGIKDGAVVWLESPVAKAQAQVKVTQCVHPEVVGVAGHFGHWAKGTPISHGKGISFNALLPHDMDHLDKISTSLDHCVPVKVYR